MPYWAKWNADYSVQIAYGAIDTNFFGVKSANQQEVYLGWQAREEGFRSSIKKEQGSTFEIKIGITPTSKSALDSGNAGIYVHEVAGAYNPDVTWATRPNIVGSNHTVYYQNMAIDQSTEIALTDLHVSHVISGLLSNTNHIRLLPKYGDTTNKVEIALNNTDKKPYYIISYELYDSKKGTAASANAPELIVYECKATKNENDRTERILWGGYLNGTTKAQLSELKVEHSTDEGKTWTTVLVQNIAYSSNIVYTSASFALSYTQSDTELFKVTLTDTAGAYSYWQGRYAVEHFAPAVKILSPHYGYVDVDNGLSITWDYHSPKNLAQKQYRIGWREPHKQTVSHTEWIESSQPLHSFAKAPFSGRQILELSVMDTEASLGQTETEIVALKTPDLGAITCSSRPIPAVTMHPNAAKSCELLIDNGRCYRNYALQIDDGKTLFTYRPDVILTDGKHTISARAQSRTGQEGAWQNVEVTTANTPDAAITLSCAASGHKATLSWTTTGTYDSYRVYRDGKEIGRTTNMQYADEYAAPTTHTYTVYGIMMAADGSGGDYTLSNAVTAALKISGAVIAATDTGGALEWLSLRLGTDVERAVSRSVVQDVTYTHYAGRDLPVAELSEYRDESYSGTVVLTDPADRARFEALLGHEVCYKRRGISVMGMLAEISSRHTRARYDAEYSFTIRAIDAEVR